MINCTFENGNQASLRHIAVDTIVIRNNKILLIKRAAHLINGNKWAFPGGFLDRGETCEQGASRELMEETGLKSKNIKLITISDDPNRKNEDRQNVAFIYEVETEGKINVDPKEVSEAKWFDLNRLPKEKDFAFDHFEILKKYMNQTS